MFVTAYVQGTEQFPFVCFEDSSEKASPFSQRLERWLGKRQEKWGEGWGTGGRVRSGPLQRLFSPTRDQKSPDLRPAPTAPPLLMVSQSQGLSLGHM